MIRAHVLIIAPAVVFLTSCQLAPIKKQEGGQFEDPVVTERFVIYERVSNLPPPEEPTVVIPESINAQIPESCAPFTLPTYKKPPAIPVFESWERNNLELINAKLTTHIEQLRSYINTYNSDLDKAYLDYVKRCQLSVDQTKLK